MYDDRRIYLFAGSLSTTMNLASGNTFAIIWMVPGSVSLWFRGETSQRGFSQKVEEEQSPVKQCSDLNVN